MRSLCYPLLPLALACASPSFAGPLELGEVQVRSEESSELDLARARMNEVPGASNVIDLNTVETGRTGSNTDVLAYQPGVYAQSAGNDGAKVSVRGSGLNRVPGAHGSGLYVMFDGLPLTGPGGTPYELFEPLWLSRAEVLRGANGFDAGALALGGSINYVTHTGYDAAPLQVRYEAGSYGYQKRQISSGQVLGDLDYYISLNDSDTNGYQDHTRGSSKGMAANIGYRFSPQLETRFYLRYRETDNQLAGRVTKDQIKHHPRSANPVYVAGDYSRPQPGSTWFANKTTMYLDDNSQLEAAMVYHDYPMDLREGPNRLKVAYTDVSGTLNYKRRDTLFGQQSNTTVGLRSTKHLPNSGASEYVRIPAGNTAAYPPGTKMRDFSYQGSDTVLHASNDLELIPDVWLTTGMALIYTRRESEVNYPESGGKVSQHDWDYAPRIGLRYEFSPQLQVYGNVSRSVEPPHPWSMIWGSPITFPVGLALPPAVKAHLLPYAIKQPRLLSWGLAATHGSANGISPGTTRPFAMSYSASKLRLQPPLKHRLWANPTPAPLFIKGLKPGSTVCCGRKTGLATSLCDRPTHSVTSTTATTIVLAVTRCPAFPAITIRPSFATTIRAGSTRVSTRRWLHPWPWITPTRITPLRTGCGAPHSGMPHPRKTGKPGSTCAT